MLNPNTRHSFDGSSGLDLPDTVVNPESFPGQMFTVRIRVAFLSNNFGREVSGRLVPALVTSASNFPLFCQVSTWMRHAGREDSDNHAKEHIVCEADDHGEPFLL